MKPFMVDRNIHIVDISYDHYDHWKHGRWATEKREKLAALSDEIRREFTLRLKGAELWSYGLAVPIVILARTVSLSRWGASRARSEKQTKNCS
jgi:hypothetical protein